MHTRPKLKLIKGEGLTTPSLDEPTLVQAQQPPVLQDWLQAKPHGTVLTVNHTKDLVIIIDGKAGNMFWIKKCKCSQCIP